MIPEVQASVPVAVPVVEVKGPLVQKMLPVIHLEEIRLPIVQAEVSEAYTMLPVVEVKVPLVQKILPVIHLENPLFQDLEVKSEGFSQTFNFRYILIF